MGSAAHLVKRFFGSLWPVGPNAAGTDWVRSQLLPAEYDLWASSSAADRRHSLGVAREVDSMLAEAPREVLAAALLHDIGKTVSGLGTYFRVAATLSAAVAGRETAELWVKGSGVTRRIGLYLKHPELGGDLLFCFCVDLCQNECTLIFVCQFGENWHQCFTRRTPVGPEIHQHGRLHRAVQNDGFKVFFRYFNDIRRFRHLRVQENIQIPVL